MQISTNMWVTVRYSLFDSLGEALEAGEREVTYLHGGYGAIFELLEQALDGRSEGEELSVYLQPEDSFGDYDPELVHLAPRDRFPAELEEGMTFEGVPGEPPDGLMYIATDVADEGVVLDANHPLAGMSLRFEMRVVDVHQASPEEIADEIERARSESEDGGDSPAQSGGDERLHRSGAAERRDSSDDQRVRGFDAKDDADDDADEDGDDRGSPDGPRVVH